jgi:hypothetical protein
MKRVVAVTPACMVAKKTWDFGPEDKVDRDAVSSYVRETVAKHPPTNGASPEILAASRISRRNPNRSQPVRRQWRRPSGAASRTTLRATSVPPAVASPSSRRG